MKREQARVVVLQALEVRDVTRSEAERALGFLELWWVLGPSGMDPYYDRTVMWRRLALLERVFGRDVGVVLDADG